MQASIGYYLHYLQKTNKHLMSSRDLTYNVLLLHMQTSVRRNSFFFSSLHPSEPLCLHPSLTGAVLPSCLTSFSCLLRWMTMCFRNEPVVTLYSNSQNTHVWSIISIGKVHRRNDFYTVQTFIPCPFNLKII